MPYVPKLMDDVPDKQGQLGIRDDALIVHIRQQDRRVNRRNVPTPAVQNGKPRLELDANPLAPMPKNFEPGKVPATCFEHALDGRVDRSFKFGTEHDQPLALLNAATLIVAT